MKIAIFTMFNGLSDSYSLVCAVKTQLKILLENKYSVKLLVSEHCPDSERVGIFADSRIEWVKISNTLFGKPFEWINYEDTNTAVEPSFYIMRDKIALDLEKALADVDVCIAHDILYQRAHLAHNAGLRMAVAKLKNIRILAFTHSQPRPRPHFDTGYPIELMYKDLPNTIFVCPTSQDISALALQYGISETHCKSVPTAFDALDGMSEEVCKILSGISLEKPEFIMVYPARAVAAKAHNKLVEFAGLVKRVSKSDVLIVFCDVGADEHFYKLMEFSARQNGIVDNELIFTSKLGFSKGVSHKSVLELFTLSNIFVSPSVSETQSLLVSEAASRGNFLVINDAAPLLKKIASEFSATLFPFGGAGLPSENGYDYLSAVESIVAAVRKNSVLSAKLAARRVYSLKTVSQSLIELL